MHSLVLAWASWILAFLIPAQHAEVEFYNERFGLEYRADVFANGALPVDEEGINYHYASVTEKDWLPLHSQLQSQRRRFGLNDWLYVKLVRETVDEIADFASDNERRVVEMHLLTLAGFDTRLCYDSQNLFVYAATDDALFEVPIISSEGKRYVNLTAALSSRRGYTRSLNLHPLHPLPNGAALDFTLENLPQLTPNIKERVYRFSYKGERLVIRGLSDATIATWMNDYPFFEEGRYVTTPLSAPTRQRLYAQLEPLLEGRTELEQLELLAAFTRGAFVYKEDKTSFGFSKPMIADEVLFYPVSDCEDRSALYFTLVRDLLQLPVLAIAYDDHLSVAVSSSQLKGKPYAHEGRVYHVCDPTGPKDSSDVGNPPYGYAHREFEIIAESVPAT